MCEELKEELDRGHKAAKDLVEHLENMSADKVSFPIQTENGCYQVKVVKTL